MNLPRQALFATLVLLPTLACSEKIECFSGHPVDNLDDVLPKFEVPKGEEKVQLCRDTLGSDTVARVVHGKDAGSVEALVARYEQGAGGYRKATADDTAIELSSEHPNLGSSRVLAGDDHLIEVRISPKGEQFVVTVDLRDDDRYPPGMVADFEAAASFATKTLTAIEGELPEDCGKGWPSEALLLSQTELEQFTREIKPYARVSLHPTAKALVETEVVFLERGVEAKAAAAGTEVGTFESGYKVMEVTLLRKGEPVCQFSYRAENSLAVDAPNTEHGSNAALGADLVEQVAVRRRQVLDQRKMPIYPVPAERLGE